MVKNKQPLRFQTDVGPGESATLTREVEADATIEQMTVRFYRGPELAVEVVPKVIDDQGDGQPEPLVDIINDSDTEGAIVGDGDKWLYPLAEPVADGDVIEVEIENTAESDPDVDLTYHPIIEMDLDREGGLARPFETVRDAVGGLF